jgi:3-oxoacyl-[acyl-carrier-protein] synthase III
VPDNDNNDVVGEMDGKGVFLHATRGAEAHLKTFLSRNNFTINDIELLIEHQANFAMIPMTLEQILGDAGQDIKKAVSDYIANKMVINIHERGNCSVVCMQRLPYDLKRDVYKPDILQGYLINQGLEKLKNSKIILCDSVGSGMTRSSVLQILR